MWLYTDLLQALKGKLLGYVFSTDGTLISASAAPHYAAKFSAQVPKTDARKAGPVTAAPIHVYEMQSVRNRDFPRAKCAALQ